MERFEYLRICMEQVRSRKIRPCLEKELTAHIEDQKDAFLAKGKDEAEAERLAVEQMGDPVETGTALDRVHRPRMDWKSTGMILAASIVGILLYIFLYQDGFVSRVVLINYISATLVGIGAMLGICFLDYTLLAKYPRGLWLGMTVLALVATRIAPQINGRVRVDWLIMLLMPIFAGVVFYYRKQRYIGIVKAMLFLGVAFLPLWIFGGLDMGVTRWTFLAGCLGMLLFAVGKGWFGVPGRTAAFMGGGFIAGIGGLAAWIYMGDGFRRMRIEAWLHPENYRDGASYVQTRLAAVRDQAVWFGVGRSAWGEQGLQMEEGYIFTGLLQEFGIVVCCIVVLMLARLLALLLGRILDQKNRLGSILGIGGFMALFLPLALHLAINLGWLPVSDSWMPFFAGGKSCIAFYMIMGMLLSIFRRQSCAPEPDAVTMQQS